MRFEDENFEEEFLKWLDSKTQNEIVEGLKKYAVSEQYSYSTIVDEDLNNENVLDYIEVEIDDEAQIDSNKTYLKVNYKKKHRNLDMDKYIELEDAA